MQRLKRQLRVVGLLFLTQFLLACAGPTTPFGSHKAWVPDQIEKFKEGLQNRGLADKPTTQAAIEVTPTRQVLHGKSDLKISIFDPKGIPENYQLKAYFNGYDVTQKVFESKKQKLRKGDRILNIKFSNLRIPAGKEKDIVFTYKRNKQAVLTSYNWKSPDCPISDRMPITKTHTFSPPSEWISNIQMTAEELDLNPALLAGLVAQESSFNPKAISWAKAIGLTQITPVADRELKHKKWKRSTKIDRYPSSVVKTMIITGDLTEDDDYRLNPQTSIEAGALYLDYLRNYWAIKEHQKLIAETFADPDIGLSKVMLASYNSGASRVKYALKQKGTEFLKYEKLKEARKYVSKTSSFCYHFSDREDG